MSKKLINKNCARGLALATILTVVLTTGFTTAQTTYVVKDGDQEISVESYAGNPDSALAQAGVVLSPADQVDMKPMGGTIALTVSRAKTVTLQDGDSFTTLIAYEERVGDVLERLNRTLKPYDTLSLSTEVPVTDGLTITLDRAHVVYETEQRPIPYETLRQSSPDLYRGVEQVIQPGLEGTDSYTYRTITRAENTERELMAYTTVSQPVNEIVAYGTKLPPVPQSHLSVTSNVITHLEEDSTGSGVLTTAWGQTLPFSRTLQVTATAYTTERQSWKRTATGTIARVGAIAVDPNIIPYGTRMYIQSSDGSIVYGVATAEDCGSGVKGKRIDLFFNTYNECIEFGVRDCIVYLLD